MVTQRGQRGGTAFGAIADPTRRAILDLLRQGELTAGSLANCFVVSRPAISRHMRVLRQAGLVRERREAQSRWYALEPQRLAEIDEWLAPYRAYWSARLHDLKRFVESDLATERAAAATCAPAHPEAAPAKPPRKRR